jgi:hypothetical protein
MVISGLGLVSNKKVAAKGRGRYFPFLLQDIYSSALLFVELKVSARKNNS